MRTVFLGTSAFAAAVLERLAGSEHRPSLVVTRPDRPAGRGRKLATPPVAVAARAMDIEVVQPESVNDEPTRDRIAAERPDVVVVCAFGALIKEPLLSDFELLNVHPSLLPRWRGAAPVERAIMAGDRETGVSIMRVTEGLDSGPVCLQAAEPIRPDDTYGSLAARLQDLGGVLLLRALDDRPPFTEQDEAGATYADKITAEDRTLDPARPAVELEWSGAEVEEHEEGCLSLPGIHVDVERPVRVRVHARDEHGDPLRIEATGLEARVIQHEIDHLDGVLILDRIPRAARKQAMRELRETLDARAA